MWRVHAASALISLGLTILACTWEDPLWIAFNGASWLLNWHCATDGA